MADIALLNDVFGIDIVAYQEPFPFTTWKSSCTRMF
jgi:hypothetical protein